MELLVIRIWLLHVYYLAHSDLSCDWGCCLLTRLSGSSGEDKLTDHWNSPRFEHSPTFKCEELISLSGNNFKSKIGIFVSATNSQDTNLNAQFGVGTFGSLYGKYFMNVGLVTPTSQAVFNP